MKYKPNDNLMHLALFGNLVIYASNFPSLVPTNPETTNLEIRGHSMFQSNFTHNQLEDLIKSVCKWRG